MMIEPKTMLKRQQVLADFGEFAIHSDDLNAVLMEACRLVSEALGTGRAKVLELQGERQELFVRAGIGWGADVVGTVRFLIGERSSEAYAIEAAEPVVLQDITAETRFDIPAFMQQAGVVALVNVPIFVPGHRPYGVLQVDAMTPRTFGADEIQFLRTYAMILGPVIDRLHLVKERAKVQERLRSSETRDRLMAEGWAQAVWEVDAAGVVVDDSASWRAYTGQTLEEWLGYGWLDAVHPDDRAYAERHWREAIAARSPVNAEFRLWATNGGWRWTNVRAAPVLDADGALRNWVGINIDIDARKRAEVEMQQIARRQAFLLSLNDMLRPLADPIDIQRTAMRTLGRHLKASRVAYTQIADDEYIIENDYVDGVPSMAGRYPINAFGPNKSAAYQEGITRIVPDAASDTFNDPAAVANFAALGVRAGIGVPLFKNGRMAATLVVHQREPRYWTHEDAVLAEDTAERTWAALERARAQATLRESEEKYRTLFESLGQGYAECKLIRNAEGRVIDFRYLVLNPAFERLTGLKVAHMLGRTAREAVPNIADSHFEKYEQIVEAGVPSRQEYRIDALDRWYETHVYPSGNDRFFALYEEITERKSAEVALRESEERQRTLIDGVPQLVWRASDLGNWTWSSRQWTDLTGQSQNESLHWGWLEPVHPDDRDAARAAWGHAREQGRFEKDYRIFAHATGTYRWFQTRAVPLRNNHGEVVEWLGTSTDVDDLRNLQDRQRVLVAELQHRTFNLMSMVRATADTTIRSSASLDDFKMMFNERIAALARVQRLLSRLDEDDRVTFDELIRGELGAAGALPDCDGRVTLEGPNAVALRSSTVQTFAMALHELTTNAVKYGALKQPDARLDIRWRVEQRGANQPWLYVEWLETGVTMPAPGTMPQGTGQGRRLIEGALPYQLKAETTYVMAADGVRCSIALPVSARTAAEMNHAT